MLTTSRQTVARPQPFTNSTIERARSIILWPFVNRYASPIWLALRLYLAWIWFQMGWSKLQAGWLTGDPVGQLFKPIVAGKLAVPFDFFRDFAGFMMDTGMTVHLSRFIPFAELAVALSFVTGVLVVPAAIGGILLVVNVFLSGSGTLAFDGRVIALHGLLVAAYRVVSVIGVEQLLVRIVTGIARTVRSAARIGEPGPSPLRGSR